MFWHPQLRLLLSIYVDDFKMAGPKENMAKGWALLREEIDMEDPATPTLYLGCEQSTQEITMPSGAKVMMMVYDMENFLGSCVARYQQCTGSKEIEQTSVFNQATKMVRIQI